MVPLPAPGDEERGRRSTVLPPNLEEGEALLVVFPRGLLDDSGTEMMERP